MMLWILMGACSTTVETHQEFTISYAESQCYAYKQCYRMLFDGKYDGMTDCEEKVQKKFLEENQADFEGCVYQAAAAQECLNEINQATCEDLWVKEEDIYQACHSDVWNCP